MQGAQPLHRESTPVQPLFQRLRASQAVGRHLLQQSALRSADPGLLPPPPPAACRRRSLRLKNLTPAFCPQGKAKKTRKFAEVKRMINPKDLKP